MKAPHFQDHNQSENELNELKARLEQLESRVSLLTNLHRHHAPLLGSVATRMDQMESIQNRLLGDVGLLYTEQQFDRARVEEILQSRIWRTLAWLGGLVLRLSPRTRRPPPEHAHAVNPIPSAAPISVPVRRAWASRHATGVMTLDKWEQVIRSAAQAQPGRGPAAKVSVITPTWNTPLSLFAEAALSVIEQSCPDWEWCIVDDASTSTEFHALFPALQETGRVTVRKLDHHAGISVATNEGLQTARAEYVCFLDHDDLLAPTALEECLGVLDSSLDAVYTDSDKIDEAGVRSEPFHKPDWSPEYFRGVMYVGHLLCVRRELALEVGGFDSRYDRLQDYEFMLRFSEKTQHIAHVPQVLYHWRSVPGSVAASSDAKGDIGGLQKDAVQAHLDRLHLPAVAEPGAAPHRIRIVPLPRKTHPLISVVIPTKDAPDVLETCLSGIIDKSTYPAIEVVCVDNGTTDPRALRILREHPVKRVEFRDKFNFSRACNLGAAQSRGEYLVFLNNDIQVITPDWVQEMLYYAEQKDVGAVGALLLYPNQTVQHAGVVLGCRGTADHVLRGAPADSDGYAGSLSCAREVSAVTAACMMIDRQLFAQAGSFNEHYFTAYQDVDLCLQLRSVGKRNIFNPRAVFVHRESYSRGDYYDFIDRNLLLDRWEESIAADPYYNLNFDVQACDYRLNEPPLPMNGTASGASAQDSLRLSAVGR